MSPSLEDLHPAQNRGFRELYAAARLVVRHYRALHELTGVDALLEAADAADRLLSDLKEQTRRYGLYGYPAAQGVGATAARAQTAVPERFLERNQAVRLAVLDVQHVVTLLGYLAVVSETNGNDDLAAFCRTGQANMRAAEDRVREAAAEEGRRPDDAIAPLYDTAGGRAGHKVQLWVGSFGEWFDRRTAHRRN